MLNKYTDCVVPGHVDFLEFNNYLDLPVMDVKQKSVMEVSCLCGLHPPDDCGVW